MGSSLALGCGGTATVGSSGSGGTGGGGSGGGAGGSGGGAGGAGGGAGGSGSGAGGAGGGAGGAGGTGGVIVFDGGGGTAAQPTGDGGPMPCASSQWDCSSNQPYCSGSVTGYVLPQNCVCNATRPRTAEDCAQDEVFACRKATMSSSGSALPQAVPFDCLCVPRQDDCSLMCDAAYESYGAGMTCEELSIDGQVRDVLCGCAYVILR